MCMQLPYQTSIAGFLHQERAGALASKELPLPLEEKYLYRESHDAISPCMVVPLGRIPLRISESSQSRTQAWLEMEALLGYCHP
jgi:hypothetical protein